MKEGTVKTSTLLIPKLRTLREFGESVTDADVDNFDELVKAGFIKCETEQEGADENTELPASLSGLVGTTELFTAMADTVSEQEIVPIAGKEKKK
jgi:hypothetical protein